MNCPHCGAAQSPGSRFCTTCGAAMLPPVPYASPSRAPASGAAIASLVLGILGLLAWCIPLFGLPMTIVGLVLGVKARKTSDSGLALAGIILCIIGLVASAINAIVGAYLGATGQHPLQQ